MNQVKTFYDSQMALQYLAQKYGSMDLNNWQSLRGQFWSFRQYNTTAPNQLTFFGDSIGAAGITTQKTNLPKAGSVGTQHFLVKALYMTYWLEDLGVGDAFAEDPDTLYSDIINGIFQAGYLDFTIGSRSFIQLPKPFLYAPPADGRAQYAAEGFRSLTLTEGTPNVLLAVNTVNPHAELSHRNENAYWIDPNVLIESEQSFSCMLGYPSGALNPIATDLINNDTNPLFVGVVLDGIVMRPVQ